MHLRTDKQDLLTLGAHAPQGYNSCACVHVCVAFRCSVKSSCSKDLIWRSYALHITTPTLLHYHNVRKHANRYHVST